MVLIRCRDLGREDLSRSFGDFLTQHLNKTELLPEDATVMRGIILERITRGEVLLLIDGLDEISDPAVRMLFCKELERMVARYPEVSMVVTSRIVGYRNMPYRMGSGFEHGVIAELDRKEKDGFAERWVRVTEQHLTGAEQALRVQELRDSLHSSDRIERLTGNPMLLTTLALVKRKVGKLPSRRTKLYDEAVGVLLNWNPRYYQTIEEEEAVPQLEYVAYEMCRLGVQRLSENQLLDLLDAVRNDYKNLRAIHRRKPEEFLELLEARSSILISGPAWGDEQKNGKTVWEFRHLTFQEYLAARALLDGRYPNRDKNRSLAEQVAPLAGQVKMPDWFFPGEFQDSWSEVLRLLVTDCRDDDVDDVMLAILNPLQEDEPEQKVFSRIILAARCLTDEPNVSEEVAKQLLERFAANLSNNNEFDHFLYTEDFAKSEWAELFAQAMINEYCRRSGDSRSALGYNYGLMKVRSWEMLGSNLQETLAESMINLQSNSRIKVIESALEVAQILLKIPEIEVDERLSGFLLDLLQRDGDLIVHHAAATALMWLFTSRDDHNEKAIMMPKNDAIIKILHILENIQKDEPEVKSYLIYALNASQDPKLLPVFQSRLDDPFAIVRIAAMDAIYRLRGKNWRENELFVDETNTVYWDPHKPITEKHIQTVAKELNRSSEQIRADYQALAEIYHLRFA
ncbi:MAG: hypothetical protein HQM03_00565 [Magnetococcales bacterium]|nr:hypothetical protein [Magnetococcales bacterium]